MPTATGSFLSGALLGLSIATPPGPVIAIMATEAIRGRSRQSILTGFGAMTADAVWLGFAVIGFIAYLRDHSRAVGVLGLCGAALLVWMAWGALRSARAGLGGGASPGSYRVGFLAALTSPFSFAWWLANGALILSTWGWPGVAGLFSALAVYTIAITFALRWVGARVRSAIVAVAYASAAMLAGFGVYFGIASVKMLAA
jgi:threonine/homoserine/homoserine lactone efflux protein